MINFDKVSSIESVSTNNCPTMSNPEDYFEIHLIHKEDFDNALISGCEIFHREVELKGMRRIYYFLRVPKTIVFRNAELKK